MATEPESRVTEAKMDAAALYREEIYTDRSVGTLRVLLPVKPDGGSDNTRSTIYTGEAQLMTNMGPLPISFEIKAASLSEAVEKYGDAAQAGIDHAMRELQELRRQASSSIVLPQSGAPGLGGFPPGGMSAGKIKLP